MKVVLCGLDIFLCEAWLEATKEGIPETTSFSVVHGDITSLTTDAVVSPANSFGFMDGGVDLSYSHAFGWHVQERLQEAIRKRSFQELLIGQAIAIRTDSKDIPWLISAPTMRVPSRILDSSVIYLAARAATHVAMEHGIKNIAFPGMGTGTGGVNPSLAARLMVKGIVEAIYGKSFPRSLKQMVRLQLENLVQKCHG